jgi:hypothetical protein
MTLKFEGNTSVEETRFLQVRWNGDVTIHRPRGQNVFVRLVDNLLARKWRIVTSCRLGVALSPHLPVVVRLFQHAGHKHKKDGGYIISRQV